MNLTEYLLFVAALGWLAAAMASSLLPGLPELPGHRHAGWLLGFCVVGAMTRMDVFFPGLAASGVRGLAGEGPLVVALGQGMILWEFARRVWNEQGRRRLSAASHLIAAEALAFVAAVTVAVGDSSRPAWFELVALIAAVVPVVLGACAAWMLWVCLRAESNARRRGGLRWGLIGLGAYGLALAPEPLGFFGGFYPQWLAAVGLGVACADLPVWRNRTALVFAAGLAATPLLGPFAIDAAVERAERTLRADLLARAEAAARPLQGARAARLSAGTGETTAGDPGRELREHVRRLRAADPALRAVTLWELRDQTAVWEWIDRPDGKLELAETRSASAVEQAGVALGRAFLAVAFAGGERSAVLVHAPIRVSRFETPVAWLALEYPGVQWSNQREAARGLAGAMTGLFAAFCVAGFVLAGRQAREDAQRRQMEQVLAADRAKTEFLAMLGHELRTPLQAILGRAELLGLELDAAARGQSISTIQTQGQLMLRLVNDLLDLGTIEAGKLVLQPRPVSLGRLVDAATATVRPAAVQKNLACTVQVDPAVPDAVVVDEARMLQVLGNLLGNAVKYTAQGGIELRVELGAPGTADRKPSPEDEKQTKRKTSASRPSAGPGSLISGRYPLVFRVRDTGPGLPPGQLDRLFTFFTRLDSGATHSREGTGVGLALVKRLVELMGGTVRAANRTDGPGAEFTVELPVHVVAAESAADKTPAVAVAGLPPGGRRVLLAEDHPAVGDLLADYVRRLGFEPVRAATGLEARALARTDRFEAVLLDINLPGLDGIALARELAFYRGAARTPRLIGCSAEVLPETRAAALAAGMDVFLGKPVTLAVLREALMPAGATPDLFSLLQTDASAAPARDAARAGLPQALAELRAAAAAGDWPQVQRRAHFVRNSALMLGRDALGDAVARVETAARAHDGPAVNGALDQMPSDG